MASIRTSILLNAIATINSTNTAITSFDGVAIGAVTPSTGAFTTLSANGGIITLNNVTSNWVTCSANGAGPPTVTTSSVGTKFILYSNVTGSTVDFAMGIDTATFWLSVASSSSSFKFYAATTIIATISSTGLNATPVGATTASTGAFTTLTATGACSALSFNATSALKYKTNIRTLINGTDIIKRLNPVRFDWKNQDIKNDIGFIADEINNIFPTLVSRNTFGEIEGLDYDKLTAVLASSLKDIINRIEKLEKK